MISRPPNATGRDLATLSKDAGMTVGNHIKDVSMASLRYFQLPVFSSSLLLTSKH